MHKNIIDIEKAATAIELGSLVAVPTETVYGLGADATNDEAVAKIYEAKGRPSFNPLIVHVLSLEHASQYVSVTALAKKLAAEFWPGALTMVMPRKKDCALSLLVSAGLETVAVRVPAHPVMHELLQQSGRPIAAPSANKSGRISPTLAEHVLVEFNGEIPVMDGGACEVGLESTVVDVTTDTPVMLRAGTITAEKIKRLAGSVARANADSPITSPGMLARHYAPNASLRLNATEVKEDEALLAFGRPLKGGAQTENLSESGNLTEAAANLFKMLRALDESGAKNIAVMPIPDEGIGVAINDRLQRATTS